jgi:RHS repeat-associated protein
LNCAFITSYERDIESSLDFAEARYYNFNHGRFTSSDPLLSSGRVEDPQTWNRYAYVLNNPLNSIDPTGLYECKGTADECKGFRNNLADAQAKLADIEKKYGKNSDEYTKAQKSLDSYGCESKGGNCIGADGKALKDSKGNSVKDTASNVQVSFDWTGKSPANTSTSTATGIVKVQFGKGNDSNLGLIANEGINSADFQDALKTGKSVSLYQSERDGLFVQAVFGELRAAANNKDFAFFNLTKGQVNYWDKGWETADHSTVRSNRNTAIDKVLTDVYKLTPKDKRPLLPIPKGYKPRR